MRAPDLTPRYPMCDACAVDLSEDTIAKAAAQSHADTMPTAGAAVTVGAPGWSGGGCVVLAVMGVNGHAVENSIFWLKTLASQTQLIPRLLLHLLSLCAHGCRRNLAQNYRIRPTIPPMHGRTSHTPHPEPPPRKPGRIRRI